MAFKQKPLKQEEFSMKIIEDLGQEKASEQSNKATRYAIFECNECKKHFKARATGSVARSQTTCKNCTLSDDTHYKDPLYAIWNGIKQRCYSPKRKDYHKYGGIGVTMCDEWKNDARKFINFCKQNGWNSELVVDKDIKCRELGIYPTIYSPQTISFITTQKNAEEANAKEVYQYTKDKQFVAKHASCTEASKLFGGSKSSIANACRGLTKSSYGFIWTYDPIYIINSPYMQ